jgi:hypothetical protein
MSNRLGFARGTAYIGTNADQPPNWAQFTDRPPTQYDNQNVSVGDLWLDTSPTLFNPPQDPSVWVLVSLAGTPTSKGVLATWIRFGGGLGDVVSLTGNVGGPVFPDVNGNINTLGDGIGITVVGTPINNTLTWSLVGGGGNVATQSFLTDDGNVEVPIGAALVPPVGSIGQITIAHAASVGNGFSNTNTRIGVDIHTVGVALDNSIIQPSSNMAGTAGMYSLGATDLVTDRFMYNYGTHNTFLGYQSGSLGLTTANAQNNTFIGYQSGTVTTTAAQSTYVGSLTGAANQTANNCTFVGYASGIANNGGGGMNTSIGSTSSNGITTGSANSSVGHLSLATTTGSNNCAFGYNAGSALVANESGNIVIGAGNTAVIGDNNTLRVGTAAGLTRAFCQGIYGVNPPGGGVQTVVQDMNGQLGTMVGGPPLFATTAFYAWSNGTMGATPFVLGSFEIVPINNVGPAGYDLGGNFNVGTFAYVCPNNGYYWFNAMITTTLVPNTVTECTMGFGALPAPGTFGPMSFNPSTYQSAGPGTGMCFGGSWLSPLLVAGTSVTIQVLYGGAGALPDVEGGSGRTFLQGYQVG